MTPDQVDLLRHATLGPGARLVLRLVSRFRYRLRVTGAETVPPAGGVLFVGSHVPLHHVSAVLAALPRPPEDVLWLGSRPRRRRAFHLLLRRPAAGGSPGRVSAAALRGLRRALGEGKTACLLSEGPLPGERSGSLLTLERALSRVSRRKGAVVVPVGFEPGGRSTAPAGAGIRLRYPRFLRRVAVAFGAPLTISGGSLRIRRGVEEAHAEAARHYRPRGDTLPGAFLRMAHGRTLAFAMADSSGRKLNVIQLRAAAVALARLLRRELGAEARVGVLLPPSVGGALANLALAMIGRVPVNLNYSTGEALAERCARKAELAAILSSRAFVEKLGWDRRRLGASLVLLEDLLPRITRGGRLSAFLAALLPDRVLLRRLGGPTDPEAPAAVLFSSGTTGEPKGVVLSHANILSNILSLERAFRLHPEDRMVGVLPFFHAFGLTAGLWLPVVTGVGALYHPNPLDARGVGKLVRERRGTLFMAPPTFFALYIEKCGAEDFRSLRYAVAGAEKLRPEVARGFQDRFGLPLLEGYGCTELSPAVAVNVLETGSMGRVSWKEGSIGRPLPGVAVKVVDPQSGQELPAGSEGLLLVKGPNVMLGYLHEPELTRSVLRDGWYVTGDIARLDAERFIEITDRLSRFSKIGGEMVPHAKIEALLEEAGPGAEYAVVALGDTRKGERLVVVHTSLAAGLSPARLLEKLRDGSVPNLWIPRADGFVEVEALPKTGIGKLDLRAVKEIARDRLQSPAGA